MEIIIPNLWVMYLGVSFSAAGWHPGKWQFWVSIIPIILLETLSKKNNQLMRRVAKDRHR